MPPPSCDLADESFLTMRIFDEKTETDVVIRPKIKHPFREFKRFIDFIDVDVCQHQAMGETVERTVGQVVIRHIEPLCLVLGHALPN